MDSLRIKRRIAHNDWGIYIKKGHIKNYTLINHVTPATAITASILLIIQNKIIKVKFDYKNIQVGRCSKTEAKSKFRQHIHAKVLRPRDVA